MWVLGKVSMGGGGVCSKGRGGVNEWVEGTSGGRGGGEDRIFVWTIDRLFT